MIKRRFWLCVPPLIFAVIDFLVTTRGQPAIYWAGDFDAAFEGNPVVRWFMTMHPALFHGLTIVWIIGFCFLILKTPRILARMVSLVVTFSHAFCAGTWLFADADGFFRALAMCIGCAIAWVLALELSREEA